MSAWHYYSTTCHPTLIDLYDATTIHTEGLPVVKFSAKCSVLQGFTSMYWKQLNLLHSALGQRPTVPCQTQKSTSPHHPPIVTLRKVIQVWTCYSQLCTSFDLMELSSAYHFCLKTDAKYGNFTYNLYSWGPSCRTVLKNLFAVSLGTKRSWMRKVKLWLNSVLKTGLGFTTVTLYQSPFKWPINQTSSTTCGAVRNLKLSWNPFLKKFEMFTHVILLPLSCFLRMCSLSKCMFFTSKLIR